MSLKKTLISCLALGSSLAIASATQAKELVYTFSGHINWIQYFEEPSYFNGEIYDVVTVTLVVNPDVRSQTIEEGREVWTGIPQALTGVSVTLVSDISGTTSTFDVSPENYTLQVYDNLSSGSNVYQDAFGLEVVDDRFRISVQVSASQATESQLITSSQFPTGLDLSLADYKLIEIRTLDENEVPTRHYKVPIESESVFDPESDDDGDGLIYAEEVALQALSGVPNCPDPSNPDSDGDGLLDGEEVLLGTNPCSDDTDGDGIVDGADDAPGEPVWAEGQIETEIRDLATQFEALDLACFTGNTNQAVVRQGAIVGQLQAVATRVANGQYAAAEHQLQAVFLTMDGEDTPPDWLSDGCSGLAADVDLYVLILQAMR